MSGKYDDMLYLPHHVSPTRARMSAIDRGAQFSPFAALVGYDSVIEETARLTEQRIELTEGAQWSLNEKLRMLLERGADSPEVSVTYFSPDLRKQGGMYLTAVGVVRKIDSLQKTIMMSDGTVIPMEDILSIESDWFGSRIAPISD